MPCSKEHATPLTDSVVRRQKTITFAVSPADCRKIEHRLTTCLKALKKCRPRTPEMDKAIAFAESPI